MTCLERHAGADGVQPALSSHAHVQTEVRDLLRSNGLRGTASRIAVLVALHDLSAAAQVADDVWLLAPADGNGHGGLVAAGPTAEVMEAGRLRDVFGVDFEWLTRADGRRVLVAASEIE